MVAALERKALLGLWCVPGVGPKTLRVLRAWCPQGLSALLTVPIGDWLPMIASQIPTVAARALAGLDTVARWADFMEERVAATTTGVCYPGDPAWPGRLTNCADAPPLLFHWGVPTSPHQPSVALVGCRRPDSGFGAQAYAFAKALAQRGCVVVSGAAMGVDHSCHQGALAVGGQTWAFLGSALDQMDPAQQRLLRPFREGRGVFYTELPPGVCATPATFPRRNRLISGASDAVVVMRGSVESGSLYTALAALQQGRPLWALPGEAFLSTTQGSNLLIQRGYAQMCLSPEEVAASLKVFPRELPKKATESRRKSMSGLSPEARLAYQALATTGNSFEDALCSTGLVPAALTSALCELDLFGWIIQRPGKRFDKVEGSLFRRRDADEDLKKEGHRAHQEESCGGQGRE